ncbi:MAG: DUF1287 domain-containing protein [Polyangiaceae bacterium]|nr:DUF1287 domain-containing protein [Polyangiaceae bacterium]
MKLSRFAALVGLSLFAPGSVCCQARSNGSPAARSKATSSKPGRAREASVKRQLAERTWIERDTGVYSELVPQVRIQSPAWLEVDAVAIRVASQNRCYLFVDGVAVAVCPPSRVPLFRVDRLDDPDPDQDGIPSSLDILLGAKKTVLLKTPYRETYRKLDYPNGEMPRDEGVCSDVVVRALRNAGFDLQSLIQADRARKPRAYPGIVKADPNIDHRRVRNLLVYFTRHFHELPVDGGGSSDAYLPGDILLFDTMNDPRPEHIGIVSDSLGPTGHPLIINSWTDGYVTAELDLLSFVPVTHRFRAPTRVVAPEEHRGLEGLFLRQGITLGSEHRQLVLVLAPTWGSSHATLQAFERGEAGPFRRVDTPILARLGSAGLARGRGVGGLATRAWWALPRKTEGDHRSPAGLFSFGTAFGRLSPAALVAARWPYRRTNPSDFWVDDPAAPEYNTWQSLASLDAPHSWSSAERLSLYELALVIRHNDAPVVKGAGSAHFVHASDLSRPTTGCTGVGKADLSRLIVWLDPERQPLLLQTAGYLFE